MHQHEGAGTQSTLNSFRAVRGVAPVIEEFVCHSASGSCISGEIFQNESGFKQVSWLFPGNLNEDKINFTPDVQWKVKGISWTTYCPEMKMQIFKHLRKNLEPQNRNSTQTKVVKFPWLSTLPRKPNPKESPSCPALAFQNLTISMKPPACWQTQGLTVHLVLWKEVHGYIYIYMMSFRWCSISIWNPHKHPNSASTQSRSPNSEASAA